MERRPAWGNVHNAIRGPNLALRVNLHEYQGKEILASYGVTIQRGRVATTPDEAVEAAKLVTEETGTGWHVIKAQVHAGGRVVVLKGDTALRECVLVNGWYQER